MTRHNSRNCSWPAMTERGVRWGVTIGVPVAPRCTPSVTVASGKYLARRVVVGSTCSPRHAAPGWILSRIGGVEGDIGADDLRRRKLCGVRSTVREAPRRGRRRLLTILNARGRVASRRPGAAQPHDSPGAALDGLAPASSRSAPGLSRGSPQGKSMGMPHPACHRNVRVAILETCRGAGRRAPAVCPREPGNPT
jgi:hypothetical protein